MIRKKRWDESRFNRKNIFQTSSDIRCGELSLKHVSICQKGISAQCNTKRFEFRNLWHYSSQFGLFLISLEKTTV